MSKPLGPQERADAEAFIKEVSTKEIKYKHYDRLEGIVEELEGYLKSRDVAAVMATGRALQIIGGDLLDLGSEEWAMNAVVDGLQEALDSEESTDTEQENA